VEPLLNPPLWLRGGLYILARGIVFGEVLESLARPAKRGRPEPHPCTEVHATPEKYIDTLVMSFRTKMRNLRHTQAQQKKRETRFRRGAQVREHDKQNGKNRFRPYRAIFHY